MRKWLYVTVSVFPVFAAAASVDELTGQWLQIENQKQQLESQWRRDKPLVQQRIALLQAEAESLASVIASNRDDLDEVETERESLLQQQNQLESNQARAEELLRTLERQLNVSQRELPPPMQNAWQQHAMAGGESVTQHLQSAVERMDILGRYQNRLRVVESMIELDDGSSLTTQQLYLGSHYAWFVTADGGRAGVGYVDSGSWRWSEISGAASQPIERAIAMVEQQQVPEFLSLPVHHIYQPAAE